VVVFSHGSTPVHLRDPQQSDHRGDVGGQLSRSIGSDLLDSPIGDRDRSASALVLLEETLVGTAESHEPRDLSDDHVLALAGADRLNELGELLATGIGTRPTEIDEPIDFRVVDVVFGEPLVDWIVLVGDLLVVDRGAERGGVLDYFRDDL
jgi:hypothetical protein